MAMAVTMTYDARDVEWMEDSGANRMRDHSILTYTDYLQRSEMLGSSEMEEDLQQIELDVSRTMVSICQFVLHREEAEWNEEQEEMLMEEVQPVMPKVRNVLVAYCIRNPRVGYVQGHADLVCFLLGQCTSNCSEEETFWLYACVIERIFPQDFFARTPKLHGFHVDKHLLSELVRLKLIKLSPLLENIDLLMVCSLLSCRWFVSIWIGELQRPLLVKVWEEMLTKPYGAVLHLVLGLEIFSMALESVKEHMTSAEWDSSMVYKIVQQKAQEMKEIDLNQLYVHAHAVYGLNEEALEDMRSNVRREPTLRKAELEALSQVTRFSTSELTRLHDEFLYLRYLSKSCDRTKLRGLRREQFELIIARCVSGWPAETYDRLFHLAIPDDHGNVSFWGLMKLMSRLRRGTIDEKWELVLEIIDAQPDSPVSTSSLYRFVAFFGSLMINRRRPAVEGMEYHSVYKQAQQRVERICGLPLSELDESKLKAIALGDEQLRDCFDWHLHREKKLRPHGRDSGQKCVVKIGSRCSGYVDMPTESVVPRARSDIGEQNGRARSVRKGSFSLLSRQMRRRFRSHKQRGTYDMTSGRSSNMSSSAYCGRAVGNEVYWCQCVVS